MSGNGKYYASNNPERYCTGPFETEAEAVEEFKIENGGEMPDFIGIGREIFCRLDGDDVIENIQNGYLYDELYEDAFDGWCSFKPNDPRFKVLSERLTKVLHDWLDEVGEKKSWILIEEVPKTIQEKEELGVDLPPSDE